MRGEHKEGYKRPRTGEQRETRQPLRIDKLSQDVRDAIQKARAEGKTWEETSELASKAAGESLAPSVVHRWYDLRIEQVRKEVFAQAERVRLFAATLAKQEFKGLPEAATAALASEAFSLVEAGTPEQRLRAGNILVRLAMTLQRGELEKARLELDKKKFVEVDKEKLALEKKKFEEVKAKVDKATNDAAAKIGKGRQLTVADINSIRKRVLGLDPVPAS